MLLVALLAGLQAHQPASHQERSNRSDNLSHGVGGIVSYRLAPGFKPFQHPAESLEAGEAGRGAGGPIADLHWLEQVVPVFGRLEEQQEHQASRTGLIFPTVICVAALAFFWVRNSGGIERMPTQRKSEEVKTINYEGDHDSSLNWVRITERRTPGFEDINTIESTNNIFEKGTSEDDDIAKEFEEFSKKEEERQMKEKLEKEKNEQKQREEIKKIQIEKKDAEGAERKENERKKEELKLEILLREQNERKIQIESEKIEQRKKEEEEKVIIANAKKRKVSHAQNKDWEEPEWITKTKTFKITKVWRKKYAKQISNNELNFTFFSVSKDQQCCCHRARRTCKCCQRNRHRPRGEDGGHEVHSSDRHSGS